MSTGTTPAPSARTRKSFSASFSEIFSLPGSAGGTVRTKDPSAPVVAEAMGFGGSPPFISRRASSPGVSQGTAEIVTPKAGLSARPATRVRPRISPAPVGADRTRNATSGTIRLTKAAGNLTTGDPPSRIDPSWAIWEWASNSGAISPGPSSDGEWIIQHRTLETRIGFKAPRETPRVSSAVSSSEMIDAPVLILGEGEFRRHETFGRDTVNSGGVF